MTLIIFDWDDTLFPTTYIIKNNINLINNNQLFIKLDTILYKLLKKFLEFGHVVVVTNAILKWVFTTLESLPETKKLIINYIPIFSARELYSDQYPSAMTLWKKLLFEKIFEYYFKYQNNSRANIISIGDSDHEFIALTDLNNLNNKINIKLILKSVRFLPIPTYDIILDELQVLINCAGIICSSDNHMDLIFKPK